MRSLAAMLMLMAGLLAVAGCDRSGSPQPGAGKDGSAKDNTDLSVFAHANIPEVERLIDDLDLQIIDRQSRLKDLYDALKLAKRDPAGDAEYRKWSDTIARLQKVHEEAKALRADTYVQWRKHLLTTDSSADALATLLDGATARAAAQREAIATIIAGLPAVTATPTTTGNTATTTPGVTPSTVSPSRVTPSTPSTGSGPKVVVLPLRNATTAQVTVTELILSGTPQQRHTVKVAFDQYSHGPRTGLANWIAALGGKPVVRAEVDALLVSPTPAAASRGIGDAAGIEFARKLGAAYAIAGEFDAITAAKQPKPENVSTARDLYAVTVRFRLDVIRVADGSRVASQSFTVNDTIVEGQFRGLSDTTIAIRLVRGIVTAVQNDQAFAQAVRAALQ